VPAVVIGGTTTKGKAVLELVNHSGAALAGAATVRLFLSSDTAADAGDVEVGALPANLKLRPGAAKRLALKLPQLPPGVPDGPYHLLAQVERPGAAAEVIATTNAFAIVAPVADLQASVVGVSGTRVPTGKRAASPATATATLRIENLGNVAARGRATVSLYAPPDATSGPRLLLAPAVPDRLNIKPGGATALRVRFTVPPGLTVDPGAILAELSADGVPFASVRPVTT
jgi:hypothetical protein